MPSVFLSLALVLMLGVSAPLTSMQKRGKGGDSALSPTTVAEDPKVNAMALKIYSQMRAGKVDNKMLTDAMQKQLAPEVLAQNKPMFDQLGDPTKLTFQSGNKMGNGASYMYLAEFPTAQMHVTITVTNDNKVAGYQIEP